jgi:CubicO group peptidase (beta-lactamase class C family)
LVTAAFVSLVLAPAERLAAQSLPPSARLDSLDRFIRRIVAWRRIPGLSIAIVDSGRIVHTKGYGLARLIGTVAVTTETRFLAGSISKAVAAAGVLQLVEQGRVPLDQDVNAMLTSWKLPAPSDTAMRAPVTVRHLLSHTGGLTVHGFRGYAPGESIPTVPQILDGVPPAISPPVRVTLAPGTRWRYSGGGYVLLQQLVTDLLQRPFPLIMQEVVLSPTGMDASTFVQPIPPSLRSTIAWGYLSDGTAVSGGAHVYPEIAAAGLWTTPTDLARFAIALQQANQRRPDATLSSQQVARMMSYERNDVGGLGLFLEGNGAKLEFSHGGRDEGFDSFLVGTATSGQAVVVMINANDNGGSLQKIADEVKRLWQWPAHRPVPRRPSPVLTSVRRVREVTGRYELRPNRMVAFDTLGGHLVSLTEGRPDEEFVPTARDEFTRTDGAVALRFQRDAAGNVTRLDVRDSDGGRRGVPRIGPLLPTTSSPRDPDAARTRRFAAMLVAMAAGQTGTLEGQVAAGTRRAFGQDRIDDVAELVDVRFHGEHRVAGGSIARHGSVISHIVYLSARQRGAQRYVLLHLDAGGMLADYDVVER